MATDVPSGQGILLGDAFVQAFTNFINAFAGVGGGIVGGSAPIVPSKILYLRMNAVSGNPVSWVADRDYKLVSISAYNPLGFVIAKSPSLTQTFLLAQPVGTVLADPSLMAVGGANYQQWIFNSLIFTGETLYMDADGSGARFALELIPLVS